MIEEPKIRTGTANDDDEDGDCAASTAPSASRGALCGFRPDADGERHDRAALPVDGNQTEISTGERAARSASGALGEANKQSSDSGITGANTTLNAVAGQPAHASIEDHHRDTEDNACPVFDAAGLREFLNGYGAVDLQSIRRVVDLKALQGIHRQDLIENAKQIELMDKCVDVLASADAAYVISSNWSATMLNAALNIDRSGPKIKIITNDLEMDADGVTTGAIQLRVQSPSDKAQWVQQIRLDEEETLNPTDNPQQQQQQENESPLVVFVGDSANDLLAMVEADVGISLTTDADSSFAKLANQFGTEMEPIISRESLMECARVSTEAKAQGRRVLFTANSWEEIGDAARSSQRG